MTNTLKHEDIYPGMRFRDKNGNVVTVLYVGQKPPDDPGPSFVILNQSPFIPLTEGADSKITQWECIKKLNEMEFLRIQTEPVQLGVVKCIDDDLDDINTHFRKGEDFPYYGDAQDGLILVKDLNDEIFRVLKNCFKLINAPKPEIPNEIIEYGQRYVWAGVI